MKMDFEYMRTLLFLSLVVITQLASAVGRDNDGHGQVLLVPFFTTTNGWDTYIDVTRKPSTVQTVLKIRVLDGETGLLVNSFNAYVGAAENWRAAFTQVEPNLSILRITEGSCTVSGDGRFGGAGTDFEIATDTGMVEVYVVGVSDRAPEEVLESSCQEFAERWQPGGAWTRDPVADLYVSAVTADVTGYFSLVNVSLGLSSALPAIGLLDFMKAIPHTAPGDEHPNLFDADPIAHLNDGTIVTPDSGEGIDAVALLLSTHEGIMSNDVVLSAGVAARTDWIISFPLRGYREYGSFAVDLGDEVKFCNEKDLGSGGRGSIMARLETPWSYLGSGLVFGRFLDIDPLPTVSFSAFLCDAVNVLSFGDNAPILLEADSALQENVATGSGYLDFDKESVNLGYYFRDGISESHKNDGRPVVGYGVTLFENGRLENGNVLANYLFVRPHLVE